MLLRPMPVCQCSTLKECICNTYQHIIDMAKEDKIMQFLYGLNVINQILLIDPLPNVNKAFSIVMRIERQKEVTNDNYLKFASYSTK